MQVKVIQRPMCSNYLNSFVRTPVLQLVYLTLHDLYMSVLVKNIFILSLAYELHSSHPIFHKVKTLALLSVSLWLQSAPPTLDGVTRSVVMTLVVQTSNKHSCL